MRVPFPPKGKRTWSCLNDAQLAAYADGLLPASERAHAEIHLSKCRMCRDNVALLLRSERQAATAVPPGWLARVRHLGDSGGAQAGVRWAWAGALACLFVAAMVLTLASRPQPQETVAVSRPPSAPPVATSSAISGSSHELVGSSLKRSVGY